MEQKARTPCAAFKRGNCRYGYKCHYKHTDSPAVPGSRRDAQRQRAKNAAAAAELQPAPAAVQEGQPASAASSSLTWPAAPAPEFFPGGEPPAEDSEDEGYYSACSVDFDDRVEYHEIAQSRSKNHCGRPADKPCADPVAFCRFHRNIMEDIGRQRGVGDLDREEALIDAAPSEDGHTPPDSLPEASPTTRSAKRKKKRRRGKRKAKVVEGEPSSTEPETKIEAKNDAEGELSSSTDPP